MIVADRIGLLWNNIQAIGFESISTPLAWMGAFAYSIELYFDFSGYSLMALGLGRMLGFEFPKNFKHPYISRSVSEFWRRWHISLGAWFKDYLLYPVSMSALCKKINKFTRKKWGNQVSRSLSVVIPASCVWIVTGVWHGAASCFVLWGIYHGILIVSSGLFEIPIQKIMQVLAYGYRMFQL